MTHHGRSRRARVNSIEVNGVGNQCPTMDDRVNGIEVNGVGNQCLIMDDPVVSELTVSKLTVLEINQCILRNDRRNCSSWNSNLDRRDNTTHSSSGPSEHNIIKL